MTDAQTHTSETWILLQNFGGGKLKEERKKEREKKQRWPASEAEDVYQAEADAVPQNQKVDEDKSPLG